MKLSVIIPTYNRANLLPEMIRSLFRQSYEMIEIVIVDDGSTDDTEAVVNRLQAEERIAGIEIRYFKQPNQGASAARNEGIRRATGDCVLFADSDDSVYKEGIASGMAKMTTGNYDFIYLPVHKVDNCGGAYSKTLIGHFYDGSDATLLDYNWHTMGAIYTRQFLDRVGGWNECVRTSDDWEFQVRVKLLKGRGLFVNVPVGVWNIHPGPRLSATVYQSHYVADVLSVCDSIRDHCLRAGRFSATVKARLFRRLIRHALEAGAHGDEHMRSQIMSASQPLAGGGVSRMIAATLRLASWRWSDQLLYWIVRRLF